VRTAGSQGAILTFMRPRTSEGSPDTRAISAASRAYLWTLSIIALALAILFRAPGARSECTWSSLETQIGQARIIFAGTARSASLTHAWGMESTRFRFEDIRYAKGSGPPDSVILVQLGGGGTGVEHQLSFRLGTRYLVLAVGEQDEPGILSAMVCGEGHPFGIWPDSGGTLPVVHIYGGYPLVAFDTHHAVVLQTRPWSPERERRWYDSKKGFIAARPPARRPLSEVFVDLDSIGEFKGEPKPWEQRLPRSSGDRLRWAWLYPHQDLGARVSEEAMLRTIAEIASRQPSVVPERGDVR
jgi:hypothetical protein